MPSPPRCIIAVMSEVTRILEQIQQGDASAAEQLLPLVYEELRRLAARRLSREKPGHSRIQRQRPAHRRRLSGWDGQGVGCPAGEGGAGSSEVIDSEARAGPNYRGVF